MKSIISTCKHYQWRLFAIRVRSNHVHLIVQSPVTPEKIMIQLKSYASRALNDFTNTKISKKHWTRHGSTRYIWSFKFLYPVIRYVIDEQGKRMSCYYED